MTVGSSLAADFPVDAPPSAPILRTEDLTVRFGGLTALNQVNFEVGRDEIRAIIGPNGAGKSTFFKILTGQLIPTEGTIRFRSLSLAGRNATCFSIFIPTSAATKPTEIPAMVA